MMANDSRKALEIRFKSSNSLFSSCSLLIAFTFLDDEWLWGSGKEVRNVRVGLMEGLDISWRGKLIGGGYNIMKEQAFQETIKSQLLWKMEARLSNDGVGSYSNGEFHDHGD